MNCHQRKVNASGTEYRLSRAVTILMSMLMLMRVNSESKYSSHIATATSA